MSTPLKQSVQPSDSITLDDGTVLPIVWREHPKARRLKLTISCEGARLTLPPRTSIALAKRFIAANKAWLQKQAQRYAQPQRQIALQVAHTSELPLRDQWLSVQWQTARFMRITLDADDRIMIEYPPNIAPALLAAALRDFYLSQARADIARWLPRYLPQLPRAPSQIRVRPLSSLWGSLNARAGMSLDLALVLARPSAFEYVLVHELCHLIHANHSPRFWAEVTQRCPHWSAERDYLHSQGWQLKAQLAVLLNCK